MRLRSKRRPIPPPEQSLIVVTTDGDVDAKVSVPWSVEQLRSFGPVTGPGHRTFVPIVRSSVLDIAVGNPTDAQAAQRPPL